MNEPKFSRDYEETKLWIDAWQSFSTVQRLMIVSALIGVLENRDKKVMSGQEIVDYFWNILYTFRMTKEVAND